MNILKQNIASETVCRSVLSVNKAINFVSIINEQGRVLETITREGVYFNLPDDRSEIFFMEFALRQRMRSEFDDCFGPVRYTCTERENELFLSFPRDGITIIVSCKTGNNSKLLAKKILDIINIWEKDDLFTSGNHTLRVYNDDETQMIQALVYLKEGLDKNETVMMLLDDDISKDKFRGMVSRELGIDLQHLETNSKIILNSISEWYGPIDSFDPHKIIRKWKSLVSFVKMKGNNGLRVFEDTSTFFKGGFSDKLIQYESVLPKKFDIPLTILCAYRKKDMDDLSLNQYNILQRHHTK